MRLGIICPLYISNNNHRDLLDQTTKTIKTTHEWVWIPIQNYVHPVYLPYKWQFAQQPQDIQLIEGRQPQAVSKAWNDGIRRAKELGCEYILVINTDIILKSDAIDNIVEFALRHPEAVLWSMGGYNDPNTLEQAVNNPEDYSEHPNFSSFLVKSDFLDVMGLFDEHFVPAYKEDCDMHARIALSNQIAYIYGGAWFYHLGSATMREDQDVREMLSATSNISSAYWMEKWGHGIINEVSQMREVYYPHPYNESDKPVTYWRPI